ncbi:MAG: hypothetical protein ACNS60_00190 [Candidatus Cyclobacteriaceae bacterium M2_1C_046]
MKKTLAILSIVLFGATACSQYTCPTYADVDADKIEKEQVIEDKQSI